MSSYWWCPSCQREIDGRHVTYEELCDSCGSAVKIVESEDSVMDLKSHVYSQWIRDIRAWLETQPGATEGDASPLDGILRVMKHKDARLAAAEALLLEDLHGKGHTSSWWSRVAEVLKHQAANGGRDE